MVEVEVVGKKRRPISSDWGGWFWSINNEKGENQLSVRKQLYLSLNELSLPKPKNHKRSKESRPLITPKLRCASEAKSEPALNSADIITDPLIGRPAPARVPASSLTITTFPIKLLFFVNLYEEDDETGRRAAIMSGRYAFNKSLKELRFLFCQTSSHSDATRCVYRPFFLEARLTRLNSLCIDRSSIAHTRP